MTTLLAALTVSTLLDPPPLDLNSAGVAELVQLEGIGEATASAIVEYRETVSPFLSVEEILYVPGIGESLLDHIHQFVSVEVSVCSTPETHHIPMSEPSDTVLTVIFLDVGNGDAVVLDTEEATWLVDGGPPGEGAVRAPVVQRLFEAGVDTVTAVAFTHPHADHIGGCRDAMEVFHCASLVDPGIEHSSPVYEELLQYALDSGCEYRIPEMGDEWDLGNGVSLRVVWLERGACSPNEASAVYLVELRDFSLLLTGDIENESIMGMTLEQEPVTVMKVPHHGSRSSLFPPWIRRAAPRLAVFCCGRMNPFGHPDPDVVQAWMETGADILRTDLNGNIFLYTDGASMTFTLSMQ